MSDDSNMPLVVLNFKLGLRDDIAVIFQFGYAQDPANPQATLRQSRPFFLLKEDALALAKGLIQLAQPLPDNPAAGPPHVH